MVQISVIIPFYQKHQTIERCIRSIDFKSIETEILIIDDGSEPPLSTKIKEKFPSLRIFKQKNSGPGSARNRGAAEAKGQYLLFLDADDFLHPDFEKNFLPLIALNKEVIVGACHYLKKNLTQAPYFAGEAVRETTLQPARLSLNEFRKACDFFAAGTCLIQRSVFRKTQGYFDKTNISFGEDIYLWFQVLLNCSEIYRLPTVAVMVDDHFSVLGIGRKQGKPIAALATCQASEFNPLCVSKNIQFVENFLNLYRREISIKLIYENRFREFYKFSLKFPRLLLSWSLISFLFKKIIKREKK